MIEISKHSFTERRRQYVSALLVVYLCLYTIGLISPWYHFWWVPKFFGNLAYYCGLPTGYPLFGNIPKENATLIVVVRFNDGTSSVWRFPCDVKQNAWDRCIRWRFRKIKELIRDKRNCRLKKDVALYIARTLDSSNQHPAEIQIVEYCTKIEVSDSDTKSSKSTREVLYALNVPQKVVK